MRSPAPPDVDLVDSRQQVHFWLVRVLGLTIALPLDLIEYLAFLHHMVLDRFDIIFLFTLLVVVIPSVFFVWARLIFLVRSLGCSSFDVMVQVTF